MASPQQTQLPLRTIGILGVGQMGSAAAVLFQRAGFNVKLWTRNPARLNEVRPVLEKIDTFLNTHFPPTTASSGNLILEPSLSALDESSDAVLECVVEEMIQKQNLLRQLTNCRDRGALVMSCTSALSITEMGSGSGMENVLVGAHFWNPPHLIPVVEMVAGKNTPPLQLDRACELMRTVGKIPIRCPDIPGFIGNRLMHAMWREALALIDSGACSAEDIDKVVKWTFALRLPALGPMENMDLVGIPLVESVERYLLPHLATNSQPAKALTDHLQNGTTGMKAGEGFYNWTHRDPKATVELRDKQIVHQLQFLKEQGVFES